MTPTIAAIVLYVEFVHRNQNVNVSGTFWTQNALFRYKLSTAPAHAVNLALASPSRYTVASSAGVEPSFSRSYALPARPLLFSSLSGSNRYHSGGFSMHRPPSGPSESALQMHITLPTLEFELSGHTVQATLPVVALYFPTAHAVHATPSAPVYPGLHEHAVTDPLPAGEVEFVGHATHVLASTAAGSLEYVSAAHLVHVVEPATLEYDPAVQFVHVVEPGTLENAPAGQMLHTLALLAAGTFEYVPDRQFVHNALPVLFLNLPVTQAVQAPPSGPVYPVIHLQSEMVFDDVENGAYVFAGHDTHEGIPE